MTVEEDVVRRIDNRWKERVDGRELLRELGIEIKKDNGTWAQALCPFHDDEHASLSISLAKTGDSDPGHWTCFAGCGQGNYANLLAKVKGGTVGDAMKELLERYARDLLDAAGKVPAKRAGSLPTAMQIQAWRENLAKDDIALEHLLEAQPAPVRPNVTDVAPRCLTRSVIDRAHIGIENGRYKLPVLAKDGKAVLNLRTACWTRRDLDAGEAKIKGLAGRGIQGYPLWLVDWSKLIVLVEGEWDALVLHGMGVNALTLTGGAGSYTTKNLASFMDLDGAEIVLCLDQDPKGRKRARKLRQDLLDARVEAVHYVSQLPGEAKDVTDVFRSIPREEWGDTWKAIIESATTVLQSDCDAAGLIAENGQLVDMMSNEVVAPFTGEAISTGIERWGQASEGSRIFHFRLKHKGGKEVVVTHRHGDRLLQSIMETPGAGADWMAQRFYEDRILVWLCQNAKECENYDTGWMFGFDSSDPGTEFERFYTQSAIFTQTGARENDEVRMNAPASFLARFDLPQPDLEKAKTALKVAFGSFYRSHVSVVTGQMLATAFLAPVRRLLFSEEPRFTALAFGQSGCGKTSRAHIVQSLFGHFPDYSSLVTWESTHKSIGQVSAFAGDSLLVVDELPLATMNKREVNEAIRSLLGVAQGLGRLRLTADGRLLQPMEPRSLVLVTCEALPMENEAQLARSLLIHVPAIDLWDEKWSKNFEHARARMPLLRHGMARWVHWILAGQSERSWKESEDGLAVAARTSDLAVPNWRKTGNGPRIVQRYRTLTRLWWLLLDFLYQDGVITPHTQDALKEEWEESILPGGLRNSLEAIVESGVEESFLDRVISTLQAGRGRMIYVGGMRPAMLPDQLPSHAPSTAPVVGYFKLSNEADAAPWNGTSIELCLSSGAAHVTESVQEIARWQTLVSYMVGAGLAKDTRQATARVRRRRVLWLTGRGASRILESLDPTRSQS